MNLKQYKNEIIILVAFLLMVGAFFYKEHSIDNATNNSHKIEQSLVDLKEIIGLKSTWADKKTTKKVQKLKGIISSSKVKFRRDGKKATVGFKDLDAKELNKVVSKILNLAVVIETLEVKKSGSSYSVEFKCKW